MKKIFCILVFIINFTNLLAIESKIIYKIENEIITNIDIKNEYKYLLILNKNLQNLDKETIFNIAKESIIKEKIKKIELIKNNLDLDIVIPYKDKLIEKIYVNLKLNSIDEFRNYLSSQNLEFETIEEKIKIEALWNFLIIKRYDSQIQINLEILKDKIKNKKQVRKKYLLSEIVFEIDNKNELDKKYIEIMKSIENVGFENAVSIYSISESNKTGGSIGWVDMSSLNKIIGENISSLGVGDTSLPFLIPGGVLILKINEIKEEVKKIDFDFELNKAIEIEREKQLKQFSKIYFDKTKKKLDLNE
jgi:peptidyl-prolyl cis-trans isomerase SurA|tara:strand:- start:404 stop:1318 length:915 start_codon:yes stop_codon:yes gene_type:complete